MKEARKDTDAAATGKLVILWYQPYESGARPLYYRGGSARTGWPWILLRSAAVEFPSRADAEKELAKLKRQETTQSIRRSLRIEEVA